MESNLLASQQCKRGQWQSSSRNADWLVGGHCDLNLSLGTLAAGLKQGRISWLKNAFNAVVPKPIPGCARINRSDLVSFYRRDWRNEDGIAASTVWQACLAHHNVEWQFRGATEHRRVCHLHGADATRLPESRS